MKMSKNKLLDLQNLYKAYLIAIYCVNTVLLKTSCEAH